MRSVYYSGHPDISSLGGAGYATHIRGMVGGLRCHGVRVDELIAGDMGAGSSVDGPNRVIGQTGSSQRLRNWVRSATPKSAWNLLRDARLLRADRRCSLLLEQRLSTGSVDFVYERHAHLHSAASAVSAKLNIPHVLEVNSPTSERASLGGISPLDRWSVHAARKAMGSATLVTFVTSALREFYVDLLGDLPAHSLVVPNAVSKEVLDLFPFRATPAATDSRVRVGFVGSLLEWHGIEQLLRAFAELHQARPNTELEIVGDGELRQHLEGIARSAGLGTAVSFTGLLSHADALERVATFDIGVMVRSNSYGSPTKLFEYAALGCAMLAPDVPPAHEAFTRGHEAMFASLDHSELVEQLVTLVDDAELRARLASAARRRVEAEYTWDQAAQKVLDNLARAVPADV